MSLVSGNSHHINVATLYQNYMLIFVSYGEEGFKNRIFLKDEIILYIFVISIYINLPLLDRPKIFGA